jgi:hypothetical protein
VRNSTSFTLVPKYSTWEKDRILHTWRRYPWSSIWTRIKTSYSRFVLAIILDYIKIFYNICKLEPVWPWWYGMFGFCYLRSQCLSPLKLWVFESRSWRDIFDTTLCDKVFGDLQQICGFLQILLFPSPIKLTATISWDIVESGVKHHNPFYELCAR